MCLEQADHGAHGAFDDRSHPRSAELWLSRHARLVNGLAAGTAMAAGLAAVLRRRFQPSTRGRR